MYSGPEIIDQSPVSSYVGKPIIFREYIGVKPYPKPYAFPTEIIDNKIEEFHFILGFAKENYDGDEYGTGYFSPNWNTDYFGPNQVVSLKKNYFNVKVIISIGGNDHAFNPRDKDDWIRNAIHTIKVILKDYKVEDPSQCEPHYTIDGIDINYQYVNPQVDVEVFSYCIGNVIRQLKEAKVNVNVVSIAPSACVQPYYKQLYSDYQNYITWVGYQFYHQKVQQVKEFEDLYNTLIKDYSAGFVLAGGSSDPDNKSNLPPEVFIEGCRALMSNGKLPGIFIWNANDSFPDYTLEKAVQHHLLTSKPQH